MAAKKDVPEYLSAQIKKTAHSLRFFRTLDGSLCTFNGSKRETKFLVDKILNAADGKARGKGPLTLSKTGYEKLLVPEACVLIDSFSSSNKTFLKHPTLLRFM